MLCILAGFFFTKKQNETLLHSNRTKGRRPTHGAVPSTGGGAGNLWLGGPRLGSLGDGSPPVGFRGEAPVEGLGDKVPRS